MVYKLYLKDEYGKKTLLAKSENKDLIEKAKHEYDNKDEIAFEYKLLAFMVQILASVIIGYSLQNYIGTMPSLLISFMVFVISLALFTVYFGGKAPDGKTYIVWEDAK